jgi:hypothetical protein
MTRQKVTLSPSMFRANHPEESTDLTFSVDQGSARAGLAGSLVLGHVRDGWRLVYGPHAAQGGWRSFLSVYSD